MRAPRAAAVTFLATVGISAWIILDPADFGRLDGRHLIAVLTLAGYLAASARKVY